MHERLQFESYITQFDCHLEVWCFERGILVSWRRKVSHVISSVVEARNLYSFSAFDLKIVGCFSETQDMQLDPRKTQ